MARASPCAVRRCWPVSTSAALTSTGVEALWDAFAPPGGAETVALGRRSVRPDHRRALGGGSRGAPCVRSCAADKCGRRRPPGAFGSTGASRCASAAGWCGTRAFAAESHHDHRDQCGPVGRRGVEHRDLRSRYLAGTLLFLCATIIDGCDGESRPAHVSRVGVRAEVRRPSPTTSFTSPSSRGLALGLYHHESQAATTAGSSASCSVASACRTRW